MFGLRLFKQKEQKVEQRIRWMIRPDMREVLDIESQSFEFPWDESDFLKCLRQRNSIGMVAEYDEIVRGYMVYELHKDRMHLLNFAVDPRFRRQGIGSAMVSKLKSKLQGTKRNRMTLEIRETNLSGQLFFRANGFSAIKVLRDYWEDSTEDAYVMVHRETDTMSVCRGHEADTMSG
jgi:[ribosomal protein S18]-alanine N-acetyltransferase